MKRMKYHAKNLCLDIGCGPSKKPGHIGLDLLPLNNVDLVINLEKKPLPFKKDSVEKIFSSHFLEHVSDPIKMLKEFSRVVSYSGDITIIVPHYSNPYSYHFTHKSYWSSFSLNNEYLDYYLACGLKLKSVKINFLLIPYIDKVIHRIVNLSKLTQAIYERIFSRIYHAWEVEFVLIKSKSHKNGLLTKRNFSD